MEEGGKENINQYMNVSGLELSVCMDKHPGSAIFYLGIKWCPVVPFDSIAQYEMLFLSFKRKEKRKKGKTEQWVSIGEKKQQPRGQTG